MTDKCESCGVDLAEHLGLKGTCAKVIALQESLKQQSEAKRGYFDEYTQARIRGQDAESRVKELEGQLAEAREVIETIANEGNWLPTTYDGGPIFEIKGVSKNACDYAREFLEKLK